MTTDTRRRACAVCGFILERVATPSGETLRYRHTLTDPDDHPVVPVDPSTIRLNARCDFCFAPGTPWVLPVENYEIGLGHWNSGDWGACDDCADLLRADDWQHLLDRVWAEHRARKGGSSRAALVFLYNQLRPHVTGKIHIYQDLLPPVPEHKHGPGCGHPEGTIDA